MINKESKYREELFKLFEENLREITDDEALLQLMENLFNSNTDTLDNETLIKKLTEDD